MKVARLTNIFLKKISSIYRHHQIPLFNTTRFPPSRPTHSIFVRFARPSLSIILGRKTNTVAVESRIRILRFSSKLVRTKSKTSFIHRIVPFSFSFFLPLFLFYIQCPLSPWLDHAYQSGKRFTDSDWYSDNENSTSPFARILLKSPPRWTDPAFFPPRTRPSPRFFSTLLFPC